MAVELKRTLALFVLSSWLCVCSGLPLGEVATGGNESVSRVDVCGLCIDTFKFVQSELDSNHSLDVIMPYIHKICITLFRDGFDRDGVYMCPGLLGSYGPVVQYVITHTFIEPQEFCQTLRLCNQTAREESQSQAPELREIEKIVSKVREDEARRRLKAEDMEERRKSLPRVVPASVSHFNKQFGVTAGEEWWRKLTNDTLSGLRRTKTRPRVSPTKESRSDSPLRVLQISDIHLDLSYSVGSPSKCNLFTCCRSWYNGTGPAGHYGEFLCDLPMQTLELLVEAIQQIDPQPDFVIYTGDNPPHDIWNNTWFRQLERTRFVVDYLAEKLPDLTIYPTMGNHESCPTSEYILEKLDFKLLNHFLAAEWRKWADFSDEALLNISRGSYYWVEPEEGLRIISINTDYWYSLNFYSFLNEDNHYYSDQVQWIEEQLAAAEAAGKKVIIIGHVPPKGGDSLSSYGEFYLSISKRYSDTIVANFFGHTHHDEFKVVLDSAGVYGAVMIAPSVTPYGRMNPSFRIYSLDRSNGYRLMDYEQYHLNLTKANELASKGVKPQFEFSYSPAKLYDLPDLSPDSWAGLAGRFELFNSLVSAYHYNFYGKTHELDRICNDLCTKEVLCDVLNIISVDFFKCLAN